MVSGRPSIVRPRDCAYCGTCEEICPTNAIQLVYEIVWPSDVQIEELRNGKR
jgi:formate hydrogenlyase subunit 6/NADH:ubiquinone oxidoreductase subunit I